MNAGELIQLARTKLDDLRVPYLWAEDELLQYLAQAEADAAERADLIRDDSTPACCVVPFHAGVARYALHPAVIKISPYAGSVRIGSRWLVHSTDGGWGPVLLVGEPTLYRSVAGCVEVWPAPESTDDGPLTLTVYRRPLTKPEDPEDVPEVPESVHEGLVYGMVKRAYERTDADTYAPDKALWAEQEFTRWFGRRIEADVQRQQHGRRVPVVRSGW